MEQDSAKHISECGCIHKIQKLCQKETEITSKVDDLEQEALDGFLKPLDDYTAFDDFSDIMMDNIPEMANNPSLELWNGFQPPASSSKDECSPNIIVPSQMNRPPTAPKLAADVAEMLLMAIDVPERRQDFRGSRTNPSPNHIHATPENTHFKVQRTLPASQNASLAIESKREANPQATPIPTPRAKQYFAPPYPSIHFTTPIPSCPDSLPSTSSEELSDSVLSNSSHGSLTNRGKTLHLSTEKGNSRIVSCLLEHGADISAQDELGFTALHYAAKHGHEQLISLLIDKGANIDSPNCQGWTPLHVAANEGRDDVVRVLIVKGEDLNAKAW
jgi:Ankyrin repeats (3 copies)